MTTRIIAALFAVLLALPAFGQWTIGSRSFAAQAAAFLAYRSYPTGTVFEENWAGVTPNPDLCWNGGPTGCNQTWTVTAGSPSVVTAPSGFSSPDVLYVPANATTSIAMRTSGTIPGLPAGGPYTISFQIKSDSYATGAVVVAFQSDTTTFTQIGVGSGTGFNTPNTPTCGTAAATVNDLELVVNGASSQFLVNGTQCGSDFTVSGTVFNSISISGNSGDNLWIGPITITQTGTTAGWWPSIIADWAGQSGTPTTTSLFAGSHGWYSNGWGTETPTGVTYSFVNTCQPYPSPIKIWGNTYTGNSCVSLQMSLVGGTSSSGGYEWRQLSDQQNESVGFYFQFNVPSAVGFTWTDFSALFGNYGGSLTKISNVQLAIQNGQEHVLCEVNVGPGVGGTASVISDAGGTPVSLSANTWYWISYNALANGNDSAWLYSATGQYLGSCAFAAGENITQTDGFSLAKEGSEVEPVAGTIDYSNVMFSFADAPSPLLPPGFPQP